MARNTSIEVYRQIEAEGLLSQRRFQVYHTVFNHGPLTAGEAWSILKPIPRPSISPRFAELEEMGVLESVGERICRVTNRQCIVWDVTANLPKERPKKTSELALLRDVLKEARAFITTESKCAWKGHIP